MTSDIGPAGAVCVDCGKSYECTTAGWTHTCLMPTKVRTEVDAPLEDAFNAGRRVGQREARKQFLHDLREWMEYHCDTDWTDKRTVVSTGDLDLALDAMARGEKVK